MGYVYLFPGQGSQHIGMAATYAKHDTTKELFEEANDVLGYNLTKMMLEGDEDTLRQTQYAQPALLLAGMAAYKHFAQSNPAPAFWAGHSVGEYTAACAAGCFDFSDAITLVHARGKAMASIQVDGTMVAILGGEMADIQAACEAAGCYIANDNAVGQVVLSGSTDAIINAGKQLKDKVKRIVPLNVSGPFHTPYMQPAAKVVAEAMQDVLLPESPSQGQLVMNVTAAPVENIDDIMANLVRQITQPVRWRESMAFLAAQGVAHCYEFGAGKVLCGLAKRAGLNCTAVA